MAYPTSINFKHASPTAGLQPINETSTTPMHPLGMRVEAVDATYGQGTFVYLKGVASTVPGALVSYDAKTAETVLAVAGGASSRGPVAVAMSANVANQYGWYQVGGSALVRSGTVADNGVVYLTSTAGQVDDVISTGEKVEGARAKAASSTNVTAWSQGVTPAVGDLYSNDSGKVYQCVRAGKAASNWAGSTRYTAGMHVINDTGKVYVCIVGGVSTDDTGPSGTATSGITDGECTWGYIAAAGGPTGTSSGFRDSAVLWDYYCAAAANYATTQVSLNAPAVTGTDAGSQAQYRIDLSAAAEAGNAIVVTGTVKTLDGQAISSAVQVVVRSLAVTDSGGDITVTAGTEKKTINPATGENVSWIQTTAAGGFAVSIANTAAEATLVSAMSNLAMPANLLLTFA